MDATGRTANRKPPNRGLRTLWFAVSAVLFIASLFVFVDAVRLNKRSRIGAATA